MHVRDAFGDVTHAFTVLTSLFHRGLKKHGGQLYLNSHVESITLDSSGRATGVQLRGGGTIKARKAVVSNASVWDTVKLLPAGHPAAQAAVSK